MVPAPTSNSDSLHFLAGNGNWISLGGLIEKVELAGTSSDNDILIRERDGSTYTINLSDYGYEGEDDENDDLTVGGTVTTYTYNGSTYSYRMGSVGKDSLGDHVAINVVNNSTFTNALSTETDVTYNSNDSYGERIK